MTSLIFVMLLLAVQTNTTNSVIHQAAIHAPRTWVKEGDLVTLECFISDITGTSDGPRHMYLCKGGTGILMNMLLKDMVTSFKVDNLTSQDSGEYSCVHSPQKMLPRDVNATGGNSVVITVYGPHTIHPALISATKKNSITEGDTLQLVCQITNGDLPKDLFFYLCKNRVGSLVKPVMDSNRAIFRIRCATTQDSGNYSCVVATEQTPIEVQGKGVNSLYIQVLSVDSNEMDSTTGDVSSADSDPNTEHEPKTPDSVNVFRIMCAVAVLIVGVIVLFSGCICQQKETCEEKEEGSKGLSKSSEESKSSSS